MHFGIDHKKGPRMGCTRLPYGGGLEVWETDLGVLNAIMGITMKPVLQVGCILLDRRRLAFKRYHLSCLKSLYQTRFCSCIIILGSQSIA